MRSILPLPVPTTYQPAYVTRLVEAMRASLQPGVSTQEAAESILLQAPDGSVWKVTVSNTGTLTTTQVPLGR
jgi:hypothetical protein